MPKEITKNKILCRALGPEDTEKDYVAVMENIELIKTTRGERNGWPDTTMTLEENRDDLVWHKEEFESGSSYAYVFYTEDESIYLACAYIYPASKSFIKVPDGYQADASFWFTKEAAKLGLSKKIYEIFRDDIVALEPFGKTHWSNKNFKKSI